MYLIKICLFINIYIFNPKLELRIDNLNLKLCRSLDGTESVRFKELAQIEQVFANTLEQLLRFAREQRWESTIEIMNTLLCFRLVQFHGDCLVRGKDDRVLIILARRNR